MALSDPQSLTVTGAVGSPFSLPKTKTEPAASSFTTPDGTREIRTSQQVGPRVRSTLAKSSVNKITTNPLNDVKSKIGASVHVVFTQPLAGFTVDEMIAEFNGLVANLQAGTNANLKKLLGGEA